MYGWYNLLALPFSPYWTHLIYERALIWRQLYSSSPVLLRSVAHTHKTGKPSLAFGSFSPHSLAVLVSFSHYSLARWLWLEEIMIEERLTKLIHFLSALLLMIYYCGFCVLSKKAILELENLLFIDLGLKSEGKMMGFWSLFDSAIYILLPKVHVHVS